jgi:uncharacterized protein YybS (DUF2232 family)
MDKIDAEGAEVYTLSVVQEIKVINQGLDFFFVYQRAVSVVRGRVC